MLKPQPTLPDDPKHDEDSTGNTFSRLNLRAERELRINGYFVQEWALGGSFVTTIDGRRSKFDYMKTLEYIAKGNE